MDEENSPFSWANIPRKAVRQTDLDAKRNDYTYDHPQTLTDCSNPEKGKSIFLARIMLRTLERRSINPHDAPKPFTGLRFDQSAAMRHHGQPPC